MKEQAPLLTLLYCRRIVAWKSVVVGLAKYSAYGPLFHAPKGSRSKLYYSVVFRVSMWRWKPSFLYRLIFNWRTFSRRVTARWWRQWVKNQVRTDQNSRNRWCKTARRTICFIFKSVSLVLNRVPICVRKPKVFTSVVFGRFRWF